MCWEVVGEALEKKFVVDAPNQCYLEKVSQVPDDSFGEGRIVKVFGVRHQKFFLEAFRESLNEVLFERSFDLLSLRAVG